MTETPGEIVTIDLSRLERIAGRVSFHERRVMRGRQLHPGSLRPMREVLSRRVADCSVRRVATLSRAIFSDEDALIEYQATRLGQAIWQPLSPGDPLLGQLCGRS
jgi:hypothetical protein